MRTVLHRSANARVVSFFAAALATACAPGDGGSTDESETGSTGQDTTSAGSDASTGETDTTTGDDTDGGTDSSTTGEPEPPAMCPAEFDLAGALAPGSHELSLELGGVTRDYTVDVPTGYTPDAPAPLIINLHGFTSNAWQQELFSGLNYAADSRGYIVVTPDGVDNSWNAGPACCGTAAAEDIDDVGFMRAIVESLTSRLCFDPRRVYATGMSNGGYMSHRLACEAGDLFAAVAPVAGAIGVVECTPSRAMPVYVVHGALDASVPAELAVDAFQFWGLNNECEGNPEHTEIDADGGYCDVFEPSRCAGAAGVQICMLGGLGHCWPGGNAELCTDVIGDSYSEVVDANATMMDFFDLHRLPEG